MIDRLNGSRHDEKKACVTPPYEVVASEIQAHMVHAIKYALATPGYNGSIKLRVTFTDRIPQHYEVEQSKMNKARNGVER